MHHFAGEMARRSCRSLRNERGRDEGYVDKRHVSTFDAHLLAYVRHMPEHCRGDGMNMERQVRLFRNGRNQALRIPRDLELPGRTATLRKEGPRLIVEPLPAPSLLRVLAKLKPLDEEFPPISRPLAEPVEF
jgi:antitoxin VapB